MAGNLPFAAAYAIVPVAGHDRLPLRGEAARGIREPLMVESRGLTRGSCARRPRSTLAFIYFPLFVIALYAFNERNISQTWPIAGLTRRSGSRAVHDADVRAALWPVGQGRARGDGQCAVSSGRSPRSRCRAIASSGGRRSRSSSSSRSRSRESSRGSRCNDDPNVFGPLGVIFGIWHDHRSGMRRSASSSSTTTPSRACGGCRGSSTRRRWISARTRWQTFRYVTFPQLSDGAPRGRAARVRALVRRGHRHDLHVRRAADAADLDLHELRAAARAARSSTSLRSSSSSSRSSPSGSRSGSPADGLATERQAEGGRGADRASRSVSWRRETPTPIGHATPVPPRPQ